jgi:hypothetical protein
MALAWVLADADGRNPRTVTLAEYIVALERAAMKRAKVRLYSLQPRAHHGGHQHDHHV